MTQAFPTAVGLPARAPPIAPESLASVHETHHNDPLSILSAEGRLSGVAETLRTVGVASETVVFDEAFADDVLAQLLQVDGVLVWVNPIDSGRDRSGLDEILRVDDLIFARYALRGSVEEPPLEWNPT